MLVDENDGRAGNKLDPRMHAMHGSEASAIERDDRDWGLDSAMHAACNKKDDDETSRLLNCVSYGMGRHALILSPCVIRILQRSDVSVSNTREIRGRRPCRPS
jgi:hypothetical protein